MHIDPRSLAFFRIGLGALALGLDWRLAGDYDAFFNGLSTSGQPVGHWIHILLPLAGLFLLFGCCTRPATLVCWVGIAAVQQANTHILIGADSLLRLLLFWSIFLPLGETWSVDAWLSPRRVRILPMMGRIAAWAITLQLCLVYWDAWAQKSDPLWTRSGNALFYALNITDLTSPFGLYLRQFHSLLRVLNFAGLHLELLGPFLLFVPFHRDRFRMLAVILFFGFHLIGMQSLLLLGHFPWVCAAAWSLFLPGFFWDTLTGPATAPPATDSSAPAARWLDRCASGFLVLCFADVLAWNAAALRSPDAWSWMKRHDVSQHIVHLNQKWAMYAPYPEVDNGWLVVPATLADGTEVDLFSGGPVSWDRPANIADYLGDLQWRSYLYEVISQRDPKLDEQYIAYLVGQWNQGRPASRRVAKLSLVYVKMTTHPDLTITGPEQVVLYTKAY